MSGREINFINILVGDFSICPWCDHLGAEHEGGIGTPMTCNKVENGLKCRCVLLDPDFHPVRDKKGKKP